MEFTVVSQGEASITLAIESDGTTLKKFPFAFRLELSYVLEGRSLTEAWKVINNSGESMYFSFGGHPAFACPLKKTAQSDRRTDCFIRLYGADGAALTAEELASTDIGVPDSNAGYICLEPWWGICDSKGYDGTLQERPYTNMAAAGQSCGAAFKIIVH